MRVLVEPLEDDSGLRIDDRIERRTCRVETGQPVEPEPVDGSRFPSPVDTAVAVRTDEVALPQALAYVRDADGQVRSKVEHFSEQSLGAGAHVLEVSGPMKLYVLVEGEVTVSDNGVEKQLSLPSPREVFVGARSYHERPAATITVPPDPEAMMTAVSRLGSALKTGAPERSFPTLRGHPPAIELGEELDVPADLPAPDGAVRIEVPATLRHVFVVAPLAYYLGAEVVRGERPKLVAGGFEHPLDGVRGFEAEVERVLKQTFFFDCLARTTENEAIDLRERRAVESVVDVDFEGLRDATEERRLAAYLSVPYDSVAEYVPRWKLVSTVVPRPENVEVVPFLVDDLAVVRTSPTREAEPAAGTDSLGGLVRGARGNGSARGDPGGRPETDGGVDVGIGSGADARSRPRPLACPRSRTRSRSAAESGPSVVQLERADSIEQAWVGPEVPAGASKAMPAAYHNKLERDTGEGDIDIVVVCNDAEMVEERDVAGEVYGSRDELPFDVTFYEELTTDRLRLVLESDIDYLHYIGHIEDGGFQCSDGLLDASTLEGVGVDAFFLNACSSYRQGRELIRRGAIGGVVTLNEVINSGALRVGATMARLLNRGFPLRAALTIARERSIVGSQYLVIGDGNVDIGHAESLFPNLCAVERTGEDRFAVDIHYYPVGDLSMGAIVRPEIADNEEYFLVGSRLATFTVTADELAAFFDLEVIPVRMDGELVWSDQVDLSGG